MREIKFRCWDEHNKIMWPVKSLYFNQDPKDGKLEHIGFSYRGAIFTPNDNNTLMQFTGLKDKNGREIYEGDIITSGTSYNLEVFWMGVAWGVRWKDMGNDEEVMIHDDGGDMGMDEKGNMTYMEVIGNIYENPEVLK